MLNAALIGICCRWADYRLQHGGFDVVGDPAKMSDAMADGKTLSYLIEVASTLSPMVWSVPVFCFARLTAVAL